MKLTPWFPTGTRPVRDGVYITRHLMPVSGPSECWHAMRWHCGTQSWYSAATSGCDVSDAIGGDRSNALYFQWRGLAEHPKEKK